MLVGWGENTVGQIDPALNSSFVDKPFILTSFFDKNICKVATWKSVSIACEENGTVIFFERGFFSFLGL